MDKPTTNLVKFSAILSVEDAGHMMRQMKGRDWYGYKVECICQESAEKWKAQRDGAPKPAPAPAPVAANAPELPPLSSLHRDILKRIPTMAAPKLSNLADALRDHYSKTSISMSLVQLVDRGLIKRHKDGREYIHTLTEHGRSANVDTV